MSKSKLTLDTQNSNDDNSKYGFAKKMQARMFAGDKNVFADCCTEDFRMRTPEFHFITPPDVGGWLYGEFAVETMSRYFRSDGVSFKHVEMTAKSVVETDDLLILELIWTGSEPIGPYAGFEDGERAAGLKVNLRVIEFWRFRDGKVYEIDTTNDSLGYYYDMASGDWKLAAKAIANNYEWWYGQCELIKKGEYPIPDPGVVYS